MKGQRILNIDLQFGSSLLNIVTNVTKMKLMKAYIDELPDGLFEKDLKTQLKNIASCGDDVLLATTFHDLNDSQKKIVVSLLKALRSANSIDELRIIMKPIVNNVG